MTPELKELERLYDEAKSEARDAKLRARECKVKIHAYYFREIDSALRAKGITPGETLVAAEILGSRCGPYIAEVSPPGQRFQLSIQLFKVRKDGKPFKAASDFVFDLDTIQPWSAAK